MVLSLMLFFYYPGLSQDQETGINLPVTVYNVEDGLDQSTVYQVLQDNRGLIWLVSGGGLQYFDGAGFRSFYLPEEMTLTTSGNTIHGIVELSPGQLIISTRNSILNFNSITGSFSTIEQSAEQFPKLFDQYFKNKPLCWMSSSGLCLVSDQRLYPVNLNFLPGTYIPEGFIPNNAVKTREGSILICGGNGYLELKTGQGDQDSILEAKWVPVETSCTMLSQDKDGEVFLLAEGAIFSLTDTEGLKEIFSTGIKECSCFYIDRMNNFWISDLAHKRVFKVNEGEMEEIRFISWAGNHPDTLHPAVRNIFEDKRGNLWFSTDGNGLIYYAPGQLTFDLSRIGFTRCIAGFEGEIWAGTFKNGLWRLPVDLGTKMRINPGVLTDEIYFFDLVSDQSGRLWAATNQGVFVLNGRGSVIFHEPLSTSAAAFISLPGNKLLLSTYGELYSCETGPHPGLTFLRDQTNVKELISFGDSYWVGNHFGLFRKDTAAGVLEALQFNKRDRLSSIPVYTILPVDGNIWAGTENGISLYSAEGGQIPVPGCIGEMNHEIVYSLLPDLQNRIWFSSNKGIGCIPTNRDRIIRFSTRNNLQSSEFNFNANLAIPPGRLFFGGINGINSLDADNFNIENASPEVGLISLNISDSAYTSGIPPEDNTVQINWRSPHLSGTVFTPDYLPAGTPEFSFLLEGYQDSWSQPSGNNMFSFRDLPPGAYRLWVRCIDSFKNQGAAKIILNFTIRPPFWKTWWFIILFAAVVIILIVLIIRRVQEMKYHDLLMELERRNAIDRERLRISQDMHDEVGSSLTQIVILSEIVKKQFYNPEEMMKLIDRISDISATVADDLDEIIWAMNPKNDNLSSFASHLRQHASEYLATAGIEGKYSFPADYPSVPMTSEQRRNIFLVAKEALHNIVKHSGANEAGISLNWTDGRLEIEIQDNGKGFETESCTDVGNGLTGMRKRIEGLGGSYSITSMPGNGTKILFSVSLII